jgi:DNA-directed RNA polymerase specialized sigma24 family protein
MALPLTKRKGDGTLYKRPARIEAKIDLLQGQTWTEILVWAAETDPNHAHFLPSECLVHLIRKAHREGAERERDRLLRALLERAKIFLTKTLPKHRTPNAYYVRTETLGRLGELFAEDMAGDNPDELDFYECQFKSALAAVRTDLVRAEVRTQRRSRPLPEDEDAGAEPDAPPDGLSKLAIERTKMRATQESDVFAKDLAGALAELTPGERDAVVLRYMGYAEESEDPSEITIATQCGITGRAVRYRLKKAGEKLSRLKEDK